jgi:hypothetical protein
MSISCGIVGLPNVGKSTLFNALTKKSVPAENYPFCTIDPSVGIIAVPDERLDKLDAFSKSKKKIPAVVEFVDIAGLVRGASKGEGKGNEFLQYIRECDAIAEVVRIFEDPEIIHVEAEVNPLRDIETINLELVLADLQTVEKRLGSLQKEFKAGKKEAIIEEQELQEAKKILEDGKLLGPSFKLSNLRLLTQKPILYILNTSEAANQVPQAKEILDGKNNVVGNNFVLIDPIFEKGLNDLIKKAYETLDLITYFTTGEDETRGWTIKRNSTAPIAGMAIHTDFHDKFIRAEIIEWDKLLEAGSYAAAREKGWLRTEGKEYVVKDGDVVEFKI